MCLSLSHTHTHTHTYVKAWVSLETDFVNVNAIRWWQQAMSAVKWALCWAECNDSQDNWSRIWNGFHFVVSCWGRLTGWLDAVFSPFILMGEMKVITDYDQLFHSIIIRIHAEPIFSQDTYLLNILTQKWHFSDTQIRRKLTLSETCLCLSNTFSWDLGTGASRFASQRT